MLFKWYKAFSKCKTQIKFSYSNTLKHHAIFINNSFCCSISSKYFNSPNFSIAINKNKLNVYNNTSYVFIDEVADCLYIVDGMDLVKYIIENNDNVRQSEQKPGNFYLIIPKKDIINMIGDNRDHIIKYNKAIANLFAAGRDESMYMNLT